MRVHLILIYGALLTIGAAPAFAQTVRTEATPFVIRVATPSSGEQLAKPGQPILLQPAVSMRVARLEEAATTAHGMGRERTFAPGTTLFGVQREEGGWSYCALAGSTNRLFFGRGSLTCYDDEDGDGRFEAVRPSGDPFLGVPLFILQLGKPTPLPAPVRYTRLPYAEGTQAIYGLRWSPARLNTPGGGSVPAVRLTPALGAEATSLAAIQGAGGPQALKPDGTGLIRFRGAEIEVLGLSDEGALRYRVLKAMPTQLERVTLSVSTSTTYVPMVVRR